MKQLKSVAGSRKVWPELAGFIQCDHVQAYIEEQALRMGQSAGKHGWRVSADFRPTRDWLNFGLAVSRVAYYIWRLFTHGEEKPSTSKQGNLAYDMTHVARFAVCDAFLSCDNMACDMARVCWPEKADSIYTYNQHSTEVRVYEPTWAS